MFENLVNKLNHLINPQDQATLDLLKTVVAPLAEVDSKLPDQVLDFILKGQQVEVLLTLKQQSTDQACALMGSPGTYNWFWPTTQLKKTQEKLVKASENARYKLYVNFFNTLSTEQIIRYGQFLAAVTQEKNYTQLTPKTAPWFGYIMVDGLITSFSNQSFDDRQKKSHRQTWTLQALYDLYMADDQHTEEGFIHTLFERQSINSYYHDQLDPLFQLSDSIEFMAARQPLLLQVIPTLSSSAQSIFLEVISKHPELLKQLTELVVVLTLCSSKGVREFSTGLLSQLDPAQTQSYLAHFLLNGNAKQRSFVPDLLARLGADNRTILQDALENETQKSVQQSIQSALQRLDSLEQMEDQDITLTEVTPLTFEDIPSEFKDILQENYQALLAKAKLGAEEEIEENKTASYKSKWQQNRYKDLQKIKPEHLGQDLMDQINGKKPFKSHHLQDIIFYQKKIQNYPQFGLAHALRLSYRRDDWISWDDLFSNQLKPHQFENLELRQLALVMEGVGFKQAKRVIAQGYLYNSYYQDLKSFIVDDDKVAPFFLENIDYISEALGLLPSQSKNRYYEFEPLRAIQLLYSFPHLPKQFIPRLLELALSENKRLRFDAQELLQTVPNIHERAIDALGNGKQEIRVTAIEWLARLKHADAVPALYDLLKKEKKEIVIAAILTALEQLGEDISSYLSPKALLKEAEKGLKGKLVSSFTWFDLNGLPAVQWQDGSKVDPQIIQWWVILADKLKDPVPNALLQRYLGLLNEKSQQTLSLHLLQSFIHQDTRHPSIEEATEIAVKEGPQRLLQYQDSFKRWGKQYPDYYGKYGTITLEEVIDEIKRERLAIYLGSAIKSKGILALTFQSQGSLAVKMLQDYMKQHYQRRAQIEAMLSSFAISDDPLIIQLLLGLSRRYRTASVQNLAKQLVEQIAERNQWTSDELADRTIPTAGLDDTGVLNLDYSSRALTAYVDDKDKFVLKNEEGKVIKALPAARQGDDEALIKEAKSLFSNSKKEFKQVVDLQTQRLYEAMCSERVWTSADWQEYLFAHPIMKRLIQRLVWLEVDAQGQILQSFRPSDDGSLLNLEDDEIEIQAGSAIKVAHAVLITSEDAEAWQAHFKDYKVKALFDQMTHLLPTFDGKAECIEDRKGWLTDTYTLRGVITKLGYQRASIEDGGSFDRYFKPFSQLGLSAVIGFSGSYVPEENFAAVLYELSFEKNNARSWRDDKITLAEIPPVLLAESYADYLKVAEACSGFDPEWQKKTPW